MSDGRNNPAIIEIANHARVGSVFGLAYYAPSRSLYAASVRSGSQGFGPDGEGAIYRIDLASGDVKTFAVLNAGDSSQANIDVPSEFLGWIMTRGLGDIDIMYSKNLLIAANLVDRRIYSLDIETGAIMASFANGASTEPWASNARVFGLGVHGDSVYHAVVNQLNDGTGASPVMVYVYQSGYDGSNMHLNMSVPLNYVRHPSWSAWSDELVAVYPPKHSQPIVTDMEILDEDTVLLAVSDRTYYQEQQGFGGGDLILARREADGSIMVDADLFTSDSKQVGLRPDVDRYRAGGLARNLQGDRVVSAGLVKRGREIVGMLWNDISRGQISGTHDGIEAFGRDSESVGDIELLCGPSQRTASTPTLTPTATLVEPPTRTPSATTSATPIIVPSVSPTPSATPRIEPYIAYLPLTSRSACVRRKSFDRSIVIAIDVSSSMLARTSLGRSKITAIQEAATVFAQSVMGDDDFDTSVAVVGFNGGAWIATALSRDSQKVVEAIAGLDKKIAEGTRIDLALSAVGQILRSDPASRSRSMVLLTDGLPNGVPTPRPSGTATDTIVRLAEDLRHLGIDLFVIGVGDPNSVDPNARIDVSLLMAIAGARDRYFDTADAEMVKKSYERVFEKIGCR